MAEPNAQNVSARWRSEAYAARLDWGMWHPFAQVVWDHEFDPLSRMVTASLTRVAAPSYSLPAVVLGRRQGNRDRRDAVHVDAAVERICLLHDTTGPGSLDRFRRPHRIELRARSDTSTDRLRELKAIEANG
jgi:hypothetical protein